ncbi:MAG: hypothetical protein ACJ71L_03735 [Nitrososphaeraceae archaeon]
MIKGTYVYKRRGSITHIMDMVGLISSIHDRIPSHGLRNQIPLPGLGFAGY